MGFKLKSFCIEKGQWIKWGKKNTKWEKIFADNMTDVG